MSQMKPLVVCIVGPTASGKTRLSLELAKRFDGEIVSADSMQIYRKMDIGTAKASAEERAAVPHHMIDIVNPDEEYSLKQYLEDANRCISDILSRKKLPILVGGTGLYVTSLVENRLLSEDTSDPEYRSRLEVEYDRLGGEEMLARLACVDSFAAQKLHPKDRKRILRGLEVYHKTGLTLTEWNRRSLSVPSPYEFLMFGLNFEDREQLYQRIDLRVQEMMQSGLEREARLVLFGSCSKTARQAIGYRQFIPYFSGEISLAETEAQIAKESRNYAKRQLTWFRRDKNILWFPVDRLNFDNILNSCGECIAKYSNVWYNNS